MIIIIINYHYHYDYHYTNFSFFSALHLAEFRGWVNSDGIYSLLLLWYSMLFVLVLYLNCHSESCQAILQPAVW